MKGPKSAGHPRRIELLVRGQLCAERCARNYARWYDTRLGLDYAEFVSEGYVAVLEHEPAWDHTRRVPFAGYIYPILRAVMRAVVKRRRRELAVNAFLSESIERAFSSTRDGSRTRRPDPRSRASTYGLGSRPFGPVTVRNVGEEVSRLAARLRSGTETHRAELDHGARAKRQIMRCLIRLPVKLRRLWRWHYVDGRTIGTFAQIEGISVAMACKLHERLLGQVRRALEATRLLAPLALAP